MKQYNVTRSGSGVLAKLIRPGLVWSLCVLVQAAYATAIPFSGDFEYHEDFASLGTDRVVWKDGETVPGWYLRAALEDYSGHSADGVPGTVYDRSWDTLGSSGAAYHIANGAERTLAWVKTSATGIVYLGNQFRYTGDEAVKGLTVRFDLEQWRAVADSSSVVTLQYRVTDTGGNILNTSGWTTLQVAALPNTRVSSTIDGRLSANQFTLGGTIDDLPIRAGQYVSFRIVGSVPNGAGFGVGRATMSTAP